MYTGHPIGGWECIQPEGAVLEEMYQQYPWYVLEWEDVVCTSGVVLQGANVPFNLRHMLACHATIQHGEGWSQCLELRVTGDGGYAKPWW